MHLQPQEEQDQEAAIGSSRRRRRSAKNQKPASFIEPGLLPKPTVSNEKSEKVQVEKVAKKISDDNLHPISKEPEIEDISKAKKEIIDTTTPIFKGKKRTSRTSRTLPEEPPKDSSIATVSQKSPKKCNF